MLNKDCILEVALNADYETALTMVSNFSQLLKYDFWLLKNQQKPIQFNQVNRVENSLYWNGNQDDELFTNTLTDVMVCIHVASKYNGKVFGGFVRNVLVPQTFNQHVNGYKDVDLWFTCEEDAIKFVNDMDDKLSLINKDKNYLNAIVYRFQRIIYRMHNATIDVIISPTLPVDDLNVNQLTFSEGYKSFGLEPTHVLINKIRNKKATTIADFNYDKDDNQSYRLFMLKDAGWTITDSKGNIL